MIANFKRYSCIRWYGIVTVILLLFVHNLYGQQQKSISGLVKNEKGEPMVAATVLIKGTSKSVSTDQNGAFTLQYEFSDSPEHLSVTFAGYKPVELEIGDRTVFHIEMSPLMEGLEEVVVIGYGTEKKTNLTGAVSSVSAKDIEDRPLTQASQALAGLATGVTVSQGAGRPGNDGASIQIRGIGTFSGAGNDPLVLIDGLAASINDIDPNIIKSISVLKDAASASIYGTRAANGVILIETKKGTSGRLKVNYNNTIGVQKVTALPDFVSSVNYAELFNEASINMGRALTYTDEEIEKFRSGVDRDNYPDVPHLKNLLTSGSGFQTNHNLGFSGGSDKATYLFSLGYLNQDGIVAKNNYQRYNCMLNFSGEILDNLKLNVNVN